MEIHTWDDGKYSDSEDIILNEDAVRLKKAADSKGHSDKAAEETRNTQSSIAGEDGDPIYHQLESGKQELEQKKQDFRKKLNQDARQIVMSSVHKHIKLIVHRPEATAANREQYHRLSAELMPIIQELVRKTTPLLQHEVSANFRKAQVYGTKFNADKMAARDFRYFSKKSPPEENPSLAVVLRVDESASMAAFGRLEAAKRAVVAVYEFCNQCGIPVLIYGDTADCSRLEQMSLFAYIDFEKPELDDKYALMHIQGRSNNRDGMALRILSEKLLRMPQQTKLFISISDGQPKAMPDYTGGFAISDMQHTLREYSRKGIVFLAAAIGQDQEIISEIYGKERFMDITNKHLLPTRLVQIIARYL